MSVETEAGLAPSTTSQKVFICYRRQETAPYAGRLYDAMAAKFGAENVFMDLDLDPGVDFVDRITSVVSDCVALIVVIGPRWAELENEDGTRRIADPEDFVRLEVETGLKRNDVKLIPALVGGARMPRREDLPPELQGLARRNALELSEGRWRYDVGRLVDALDELVPEAGGSQRVGPPEPSPAARGRRPAFEGAAVAGLVALLGRYLAESIGELKNAEPDEPNPEMIEHIWTELARRTGTLALVGAALGIWLALRVFAVPPSRWIAKGLLIGGIAGLIGGLIWTLPVYYPDAKAEFDKRASIELASLAVSGGILGVLIGSIWRPPRRSAAFWAGAVAGLVFAAIVWAISWKTKTADQRVWLSGLAAALITGSVVATMLARDRAGSGTRAAE